MSKTIIVGVTSSIACYKSVQLVSDLLKKGYEVEVIMTENATQFIAPLTFSSLTKRKTYVHTFDRDINWEVEHISLAKKADAFIIAPASANVIAKITHGICDDLLTTTFLAAHCPKIIAPAMNTQMLLNPVTQNNLKLCQDYGYSLVDSSKGLLACGDVGLGKLASIEVLIDAIESALVHDRFLQGKKVLISGGPTVESIDPVRFISNHSSGKMGYALAKIARNHGAEVTFVCGPTQLPSLSQVNTINILSAEDLSTQMLKHYKESDIVIMAAAVADYTPKYTHPEKMKKTSDHQTLELVKTNDILAQLGRLKEHQFLCGFAMETENVIENAIKKREKKNCDLLVVNDLREPGAGFKVDTNRVTLVKEHENKPLSLLSKDEVALEILLEIHRGLSC